MRTANNSCTNCYYDTANCLHHASIFAHDRASCTILQDFIRWPRDQRTCYKSPIARDRIGHFGSNRHALLFYSLAPIPAYLLAHRPVRDVGNGILDPIDITFISRQAFSSKVLALGCTFSSRAVSNFTRSRETLSLTGLKLADRNGKFNYIHLQIEVCALSVRVFRLARTEQTLKVQPSIQW